MWAWQTDTVWKNLPWCLEYTRSISIWVSINRCKPLRQQFGIHRGSWRYIQDRKLSSRHEPDSSSMPNQNEMHTIPCDWFERSHQHVTFSTVRQNTKKMHYSKNQRPCDPRKADMGSNYSFNACTGHIEWSRAHTVWTGCLLNRESVLTFDFPGMWQTCISRAKLCTSWTISHSRPLSRAEWVPPDWSDKKLSRCFLTWLAAQLGGDDRKIHGEPELLPIWLSWWSDPHNRGPTLRRLGDSR